MNDPRNGEPFGEMGLVMQKDFDWQDQTGAPDDPQPGNIPGGTRDVLRGADFNNITTSVDPTGTCRVRRRQRQLDGVRRAAGGFAHRARRRCGERLLRRLVPAGVLRSPRGDQRGEAARRLEVERVPDLRLRQPDRLQVCGFNISTNKIEMGHRTAAGWIVDVSTPAQVKSDTDYNLLSR